jgi:hypothetical protein
VVQVALVMVPVLLLPEASTTVEPVPSLKLYAATRPSCAQTRTGENREVIPNSIANPVRNARRDIVIRVSFDAGDYCSDRRKEISPGSYESSMG